MSNKLTLPKPYLSYSQFSLWLKNKEQYRERYYLDGKSFETKESIFGKHTAQLLEDGVKDEVLDRVPRYHFKEYRIEEELGGIPFLGVLDSFKKKTGSILEYKTSKNPWTDIMVLRHLQLDLYSALVKKKFGYVDPWVQLVWIETRWKQEVQQVGSRTLIGDSNELEYTGRIETFKRRISEWERKSVIEKVRGVAEEISADYQSFLKSNETNITKNNL